MSGTTDLSIYKGKALVFTSQEEQVENEVFTTLNTEIEIKKDQFHNIYPVWYPRKELTNQIGSGMGIEHTGKTLIEEVFGDMEEYPDGRKVRKIEGYRCIKDGRRRRPDGTWQSCSEMYEFNWVGRAKIAFLDDEEKSENDRNYTFSDLSKQKRKREKFVEELKKFAVQRASTGADLCIIRALTGMSTSFKANEIAIGKIVVSQIVESKMFQAKKAQASIDNIRMGGDVASNVDDASKLLIGSSSSSSENTNKIAPVDKKEEEATDAHPPTVKDQFDSLIKDDRIISLLSSPGPDESPISASIFYQNVVNDNGGSDDVMNWAINEMMQRIK